MEQTEEGSLSIICHHFQILTAYDSEGKKRRLPDSHSREKLFKVFGPVNVIAKICSLVLEISVALWEI